MKLGLRALLATVVMAAGIAAVPTPSNATNIGQEGCTPGYWKNHTSSWQETKPTVTFGTLYTSARPNVANLTLAKALDGGGGPGLDGAAVILARAATAAWLNAAHEGLGYPWRRSAAGLDGRPPLFKTVNAAFASNSRDTMLALATRLDADNNLGCPLS
jgi:hypothetical protein